MTHEEILKEVKKGLNTFLKLPKRARDELSDYNRGYMSALYDIKLMLDKYK